MQEKEERIKRPKEKEENGKGRERKKEREFVGKADKKKKKPWFASKQAEKSLLFVLKLQLTASF